VSPPGAHTRRSVLLASVTGAGTLLLSGCGGSRPRPRAAPVLPEPSDVELINAALAVEQRAIALYEPSVPLLTGVAKQAASLFLGQELEHAGELRKLITQAGARAHNPKPHYDFGRPRGARHLLTLMHELERQQLAAYLWAMPRLSSPELRQILASIMANDAQHVLVLRAELERSAAAPPPFLSASE
jgi:rubrerythrin